MDDYYCKHDGQPQEVIIQINTLHCQQKEIRHKGDQMQVYGVCIVCTVVCQKAPVGLKQSLAVKIMPIASAIKLCLSKGVSK